MESQQLPTAAAALPQAVVTVQRPKAKQQSRVAAGSQLVCTSACAFGIAAGLRRPAGGSRPAGVGKTPATEPVVPRAVAAIGAPSNPAESSVVPAAAVASEAAASGLGVQGSLAAAPTAEQIASLLSAAYNQRSASGEAAVGSDGCDAAAGVTCHAAGAHLNFTVPGIASGSEDAEGAAAPAAGQRPPKRAKGAAASAPADGAGAAAITAGGAAGAGLAGLAITMKPSAFDQEEFDLYCKCVAHVSCGVFAFCR